MKDTFPGKFTLHFLIYLIGVGLVAAFPLYKLVHDSRLWEALGSSFALFFVLTVASYWIIMRHGQKKGNEVLMGYFGSIAIKMVVALVYFLVMLQGFKGFELQFALAFFSAYLICTGFEVYYILRNLRQI